MKLKTESWAEYGKRAYAERTAALEVTNPDWQDGGENFSGYVEYLQEPRSPRGDVSNRRASWKSQEERLAKAAASAIKETPYSASTISATPPPPAEEAPPYEDSEEEEEQPMEQEEGDPRVDAEDSGENSDIGWLEQAGPVPAEQVWQPLKDQPTDSASDEKEEEEVEREAEEQEDQDYDSYYLDELFQEEEQEACPRASGSSSRRIVTKKSKLPLRLRQKGVEERRADFRPRGKKAPVGTQDLRVKLVTNEQKREQKQEQEAKKRGAGRGGGGSRGKPSKRNR